MNLQVPRMLDPYLRIRNTTILKEAIIAREWIFEGNHYRVSLFLSSGHTLTFILTKEEKEELFGKETQ